MAVDPAGSYEPHAAASAVDHVTATLLAATDPGSMTDAATGAPPPEAAFPPFDGALFASHLFWLAIAFGILYYAMSKLIVPQVGGILEDRRDRIAGDLGEANRLKRETDEVIATYERELGEARAKAHAIAQGRRDEIKREIAERQAETERALQAKIADSEKTIAEMRDRALADVDQIAAEAARAIIARVSPVEVSDGDVASAVDGQRAA